jgi:hypothetical protein
LTRAADLATLLRAAPFAIAAGYIVLFLVRLPQNVTALGWNPDVGSAFAMPETLVQTGTGGATVMASAGQWVPLWFGLLTARLPLHRELWDIAPTLDFVASALIVGWSVARLTSGRLAAWLAVLICLVASPLALDFFMAPFSHNTVYPFTALLGAYLIWLAKGQGRRRAVALAAPPVLGVAIGACMASDLLLVATAVIPLGVSALLALLWRDRRSVAVALSALTTIVVAVPISSLTSSIMRSEGFLKLPSPIHHATLSELPARAELLFKGLQADFNGYLGGAEAPGALQSTFGIASDVVMCAALLALLALGVAGAVRLLRSGLRRDAARTPTQLARSLHVVYWATSTVTACGAFWLAGEGPTTTHESYYATAIFAVAAVVPLLLSSRSRLRLLIPAGATVFFVASLLGLANDYVVGSAPLQSTGEQVEKLAAANHVTYGYTNWGDASNLTWGTHNRVIARPLAECQTQRGVGLCPGFQAYVPSWYVPRNRHTFLLVDPKGIEIKTLPEGLGRPIAAYNVGAMQLYIYPYDIASRLA